MRVSLPADAGAPRTRVPSMVRGSGRERRHLMKVTSRYCSPLGTEGAEDCKRRTVQEGGTSDLREINFWSHPPGLNRRPADYEVREPAPNPPMALY